MKDISELPQVEWGGLSAPCESAPVDFSISQSERRWPYVDGAGHDNTGRDAIQTTLRLYFVDTMLGGKKWFSEEWPNWWPGPLLDGEARDFYHPLIGDFRARVLKGHIDFKAQTRSGIIVDISFTETVENPDELNILLPESVDPGEAAKAADEAAEEYDIPYPDGVPGGGSLFDAWNSIKGQIGSMGMQIVGKITSFQSQVGSMIDDAHALNDGTLFPFTSSAERLWAALEDTKNSLSKPAARRTETLITNSETTLSALADEVGNTVSELMGLNLPLLRSPSVPKGATVVFYAGK